MCVRSCARVTERERERERERFWYCLCMLEVGCEHLKFIIVPLQMDNVSCEYVIHVQTILLVPVLPHGVLQLGSFDEVCVFFYLYCTHILLRQFTI
jgi:hypothetical protein